MSDSKTHSGSSFATSNPALATASFFRSFLRSGTKAERRWENTIAAMLLVVSALPMVALADAVAMGASPDAQAVALARVSRR